MSRLSQHPCHVLDRRPRLVVGLLTGISLLLGATPLLAAWSNTNSTDVFLSNDEISGLAVASDDNGGTLAMILDSGFFPHRARLSRLNRAGTELWGDGGVAAPFDVNTTNQGRPVAIEPDGAGGAFCVWEEWYTTSGVFHLARLDPSGVQMWSVDVASAGSAIAQAGVELVLEPGIGITVGFANATSQRLIATRYDFDGNLLWSTDVNGFYHHNIRVGPTGDSTSFDMRPDGLGGVLFAWYRYDIVAYQNTGLFFEQIGAQRVDSLGNRLWGNDGHMVWQQPGFWHTNAFGAEIVTDGAGGAYVVTSGGSSAYGQHLDALGNETWATNGIVLQNTGASSETDTDPRICSDTVGGFYLVQQRGTIYASRFDINGTPLWGAAGIIVAQSSGPTEFLDDPAIDEDEFGGAVIGYHDWANGAESLGGARVDAFGTVLWNDEHLFDADSGDEIRDVHVVADGIGGAQYVWKLRDPSIPKEDVHALGVNGEGLPPNPVLFGILPDSGEPGEVLPSLVFGDYIDDTMNFSINQGTTSIPITAPLSLAPNLVGGWLDLTGAALGPWNLAVDTGTGMGAVLADAFGVGYRPDCASEVPVSASTTLDPPGSFRMSSFDSKGVLRSAWMTSTSSPTDYIVHLSSRANADTYTEPVAHLLDAKDVTFTVDDLDREVISYVRDGNVLVQLVYDRSGGGLQLVSSTETTFIGLVYRPVLCTTPDGIQRTVGRNDEGSGDTLFMTYTDASGKHSAVIPNLGQNPREVDLATTSDGMVMIYVRDTWLPGVSEVVLQHFRNGAWEAPTPLTFGLSITSPSVACDRNGKVLASWILDNSGNGSAPTLQTQLISNGGQFDVRTRATDGPIYRVQVDAQGPDRFFMLTQETGQPMQIFLRGGDGHVFYPKARINTDDDVDWPSFAVQYNGLRVGAVWQAYNNAEYGDVVWSWLCGAAVMTSTPDEVPAAQSTQITASPNPFNPRTQLHFELTQPQWTKLEIFDSRGRRVRTLHDGPLSGGPNTLDFDGRDDHGAALASGVYFAQLRPSVDAPAVVKLTLLK